MPLQKLQFRAGINRDSTSYTNEGGWFDGDKVRFRNGLPEKIGGWTKYSDTQFQGTCRALHTWTALDNTNFIGIGTSQKYYLNAGGVYYDITPLRLTTGGGDVTFSATNGSSTITVTDTDHGANLNDFVTFTNAATLGGNVTATVLNQEYQIASVTASNTYTITAKDTSGSTVTANGSDSGSGGSSTVGAYQINVGLDDNSYGTGWGAGIFGGKSGAAVTTAVNDGSNMSASATSVTVDSASSFTSTGYLLIGTEIIEYTGKTSTTFTGLTRGLFGTTAAIHNDDATVTEALGGWGMPATTTVAGSQLRHWSHDNFGEDLIMNVRDGAIYYWDKSGGTSARAVEITTIAGSTNAPTIAKKVIVSERDRHVLAFGCDSETASGIQDPLLIRFASQESLTAWNALPTNTAGELRIGTGSEIITAVETRQQILVFTDESLYSMQFLGPPFTFGISLISENTTIKSPLSSIAVADSVFWMGQNEFFVYDGTVRRLPCTVRGHVFNDFNNSQSEKVVAALNSKHSEIWWFYPSASSQNIDKYVVFNYIENVWYYGILGRTAWIDQGIYDDPIAASSDGYLYEHETGFDDGSTSPSSAINAYIESSQMDLGDGHNFSFISRLIPDITFINSSDPTPSATMTLKTRNFPGGNYLQTVDSSVEKSTSVPVEQFTTQAHVRLRGRSFALKISSNEKGVAWRLGFPRIEIRQDGRK